MKYFSFGFDLKIFGPFWILLALITSLPQAKKLSSALTPLPVATVCTPACYILCRLSQVAGGWAANGEPSMAIIDFTNTRILRRPPQNGERKTPAHSAGWERGTGGSQQVYIHHQTLLTPLQTQ
eukprot:GHVT01090046.1.p2 GENE.GHVT01090046.1~~GHVT01090046.1.p2  ORF type:complete len:124 (-),score=11.21 GHVT01090046.1:1594-1965(-)